MRNLQIPSLSFQFTITIKTYNPILPLTLKYLCKFCKCTYIIIIWVTISLRSTFLKSCKNYWKKLNWFLLQEKMFCSKVSFNTKIYWPDGPLQLRKLLSFYYSKLSWDIFLEGFFLLFLTIYVPFFLKKMWRGGFNIRTHIIWRSINVYIEGRIKECFERIYESMYVIPIIIILKKKFFTEKP